MTIDQEEVYDPGFQPISDQSSLALWVFVCLGLPGIILGAFWINGYLGFKL